MNEFVTGSLFSKEYRIKTESNIPHAGSQAMRRDGIQVIYLQAS